MPPPPRTRYTKRANISSVQNWKAVAKRGDLRLANPEKSPRAVHLQPVRDYLL